MAAEPRSVFVSILPQKFFVQQICKDRLKVEVMVAPGASPATYEPKPRQMAALAGAQAYFAIGVPFEKVWLAKFAAANPEMRVVHTDQGIQKRIMAAHHHHDEALPHDGHDGEDAHEPHTGQAPHAEVNAAGHDPHIWLSPRLVKIQARTILTSLKTLDPAHGQAYEANYNQFVAAIDALDHQLTTIFADHRGLEFMVFHPSWGYFAEAYGLTQVPIELEGKHPKPAQLQALIQHAREREIKMVFVQPQFSTKSARLIAREIGGQVVFADPLAEDWMDNLHAVAAKFITALK
jgi:zinc transport system substrate-binding protein